MFEQLIACIINSSVIVCVLHLIKINLHAAYVACHITMLVNFDAKMFMLYRYCTQCLKITRLLNFTIPSTKTFTKHKIQHVKIIF